jgi:soluble cytochrome b562
MTRTRSLFPTLIAALLGLAFVAAPAAHAADKEKKKGEDTPLGKAMEELGDAVKALKKSVKDPAKKEESIKLIDKAYQASVTSKIHLPAMLAKVPEADKAKTVDGYRKMMAQTIAELAKLEQQVLEGKTEDAVATMKALKTLEDDGHEKYNQ